MLRTFIGIALPVVTRQALRAAQEDMRRHSPAWRGEKWVAEENLHVTIKYLGSLPEELADEAGRVLTDAVAAIPWFNVTLGGIVPIPRARSSTMMWTMLDEGVEEMTALAATVNASLSAAGFPAETRAFKPHVTLVRARGARRVAFETLDAGNHSLYATDDRAKRVSVRGVTLYTSTLTPQGPVYMERHFAPCAE